MINRVILNKTNELIEDNGRSWIHHGSYNIGSTASKLIVHGDSTIICTFDTCETSIGKVKALCAFNKYLKRISDIAKIANYQIGEPSLVNISGVLFNSKWQVVLNK